MAAASEDEESGIRSVTPLSAEHLDTQMGAIGYLMAALLAVVILPLLPIIVLVWLVGRALGR